MRLKLTIGYDGAAFKGWQSQPFGNTVQDVLEGALRKITGERVIVHGSGRTDTGVHALGQCAHIDVTDRFSAEWWQRILNFNLPNTIRIMQCELAEPKFHASLSAKGKIYRYQIRNQSVVSPHEFDRVWLVPEKLNLDLLRETAALFEGEHDFAGFGANRKNPKRTVRTISSLSVTTEGALISLTFCGKGFLYRMVRMITGSLVRVARGQDDFREIATRLHGPGAPNWEHAAPACGLYLVEVLY